MNRSINDSLHINEKVNLKKVNHSIHGEFELGRGYHRTPSGISVLDEVVFKDDNCILLGGVQEIFEKMYGVRGNITIPTMYDLMKVGCPNTQRSTVTYDTPYGTKQCVHDVGKEIFGYVIGITGTAENTITEYPVNYRENSITMKSHYIDGAYLDGIQIPFRYTGAALTASDRTKYFGKKTFEDGMTGYYFKCFEQVPEIKHAWKSSNLIESDDDIEDVLATDNDVWNLERSDQCTSYTEKIVRIRKNDMKEWFIANDQANSIRFNCIGLVSGRYNKEYDDYEDVTLVTKINFQLTPMSMNNDWWGIYRMYGC